MESLNAIAGLISLCLGVTSVVLSVKVSRNAAKVKTAFEVQASLIRERCESVIAYSYGTHGEDADVRFAKLQALADVMMSEINGLFTSGLLRYHNTWHSPAPASEEDSIG